MSDVLTEFAGAQPGKSVDERVLLKILALIQVTLFALIAFLAVYVLCAMFDTTMQVFKEAVFTMIEIVDRQSDARVRSGPPALPVSV